MFKFWQESNVAQRVIAVLLVVVALAMLGSLVWDYPAWPFSVLIALSAIANLIASGQGQRPNPQESDPNKR
jgi:hypothetical protein